MTHARWASFRRLAPGVAAAAIALAAGACGLRSSAPTKALSRHSRAATTTVPARRRPAARRAGSGLGIGQIAGSATQVALAVASFAAVHPGMSSLGCTSAALRSLTAANRLAPIVADFPLPPELVQCGDLAVAQLPASVGLSPATLVLGLCAGATAEPPGTVQTIGGDNWVLWPWYSPADWPERSLVSELASSLGVTQSPQPYSLTLESTDPPGSSHGASCETLHGVKAPSRRT